MAINSSLYSKKWTLNPLCVSKYAASACLLNADRLDFACVLVCFCCITILVTRPVYILGLALMMSWSARSDDAWVFGRELLKHPTQDGQQAFVFSHMDPRQMDYGLPGISYKPIRRVSLKALSILIQGDPSDIDSHYLGVYINTEENLKTDVLRGQAFLFNPSLASSVTVEAWEPDGIPTDFLSVTLTFPQPVELSPDHVWMISPYIKLDAFQDNGFILPSMVASQSSESWGQGTLLGEKVDQYASQTVTFEDGEFITRSSSVNLTSQFAADLLISTTPRQEGDGSPANSFFILWHLLFNFFQFSNLKTLWVQATDILIYHPQG